ncbi:MAG TPA: 3-isopropylmalate dehydratase [Syntrophorhabdaceae bacterium]|nr:3-isopropylmalate dehydratase [Syntrophorhabdaceae bacterium]HPA07260.1 3-isopropylmalate dehydratase [Methanoregulaceae archaeon]
MNTIQGEVWKFGDNIDTDAIVPGRYLDASLDEIAPHVFESLNPKFAGTVKQGDIIVAGKNFGCGSSRENAPAALKKLGIGCIIAESFARIFFRNAIAIGLPVITSHTAFGSFSEGERALVNFVQARIENTTLRTMTSADPLPDEVLSIIEKGGILNLLKEIQGGKQ